MAEPLVERCSTCGQPFPAAQEPRLALLLRFLARPIEWRPEKPSKKHPFNPRRSVYVAKQSPNEWYLTYSSELPIRSPFSRVEVMALRDRGYVAPTYPDGKAAELSFNITDAGLTALGGGNV